MQSRRVQSQGYVTQHQLQALMDKVDKLQLALDRLPPPSSVVLPSTARPTHQTNSSMAVQSERGHAAQTSFKSNRYKQQNNSPTRAASGQCFQCGEEGHYKRNPQSIYKSPCKYRDQNGAPKSKSLPASRAKSIHCTCKQS